MPAHTELYNTAPVGAVFKVRVVDTYDMSHSLAHATGGVVVPRRPVRPPPKAFSPTRARPGEFRV